MKEKLSAAKEALLELLEEICIQISKDKKAGRPRHHLLAVLAISVKATLATIEEIPQEQEEKHEL